MVKFQFLLKRLIKRTMRTSVEVINQPLACKISRATKSGGSWMLGHDVCLSNFGCSSWLLRANKLTSFMKWWTIFRLALFLKILDFCLHFLCHPSIHSYLARMQCGCSWASLLFTFLATSMLPSSQQSIFIKIQKIRFIRIKMKFLLSLWMPIILKAIDYNKEIKYCKTLLTALVSVQDCRNTKSCSVTKLYWERFRQQKSTLNK